MRTTVWLLALLIATASCQDKKYQKEEAYKDSTDREIVNRANAFLYKDNIIRQHILRDYESYYEGIDSVNVAILKRHFSFYKTCIHRLNEIPGDSVRLWRSIAEHAVDTMMTLNNMDSTIREELAVISKSIGNISDKSFAMLAVNEAVHLVFRNVRFGRIICVSPYAIETRLTQIMSDSVIGIGKPVKLYNIISSSRAIRNKITKVTDEKGSIVPYFLVNEDVNSVELAFPEKGQYRVYGIVTAGTREYHHEELLFEHKIRVE